MAKILGWAVKKQINEQFAEKIFGYTDAEKIIRIKSILSENPSDAVKLIQSVLEY